MKENEKETISIETMTGVGKKKTIAGKEYYILPVNIEDMHYIIGEENPDERLIILDKKQLEDEENDVTWQMFGLNIIHEKRKETFMKILNKYVYYIVNGEQIPMTEKLLIEHNWSFKEIGEFILTWCQVSD